MITNLNNIKNKFYTLVCSDNNRAFIIITAIVVTFIIFLIIQSLISRSANIDKKDLDAIAYTRGPGLLGSLLVGSSFAKSLSLSLNIPLIEVNHMQAHLLAHFIEDNSKNKANLIEIY